MIISMTTLSFSRI